MSLEAEFKKLKSSAVDLKSMKYAQWTDAALYPDADEENLEQVNPVALSRDWQSFGQQIINYAASKAIQSLFPIGKAFFKIDLTKDSLELAAESLGYEADEVARELVDAANEACKLLHWKGNYSRLTWAAKVAFVTGNVLFVYRKDGSLIPYTTRSYVVKRDGSGAMLKLILKERQAYRMLPPSVQAGFSGKSHEDMVDVYHCAEWQAIEADGTQMVKLWQEAGTWKSDSEDVRSEVCPYIPVAIEVTPGESYGRGRVEANAGDFARYSELSRALTLYEIEACKVVNAVRPGSGSDTDALNSAESGEYVSADPDAIKAMEFGDGRKIAEIRNELMAIEQRLARTFGYGANMRDAERVEVVLVALYKLL